MLKVLTSVTLLAFGCGSPSSPSSRNGPQPVQSADDQVVSRECGRCHDGRRQSPKLLSVADLKAAHAKAELNSQRMPPDRRLAADVKAKLVSLAE